MRLGHRWITRLCISTMPCMRVMCAETGAGALSCKRLMAGLEPREMCVFETSWAVFQLRAERGRMGRMRSKVDELRGNMRSVCESEGFGFSAN